MLNGIITIMQKELKDALRDPGAMFAAILYTLIGPALLLTIITIIPKGDNGEMRKVIDLVIDDQSSPLVEFMKEQDFILDETSEIKVLIPDNMEATIEGGNQIVVEIEADLTKNRAVITAIREAFTIYNNDILQERLKEHNLTLEYIEPIKLQTDTQETVRSALGDTLVSMVCLSFFMAIAFTGMSLSIDMTAGERERMTLEPLLAQPVSTLTIIGGKWATSFIVAMFGSALTATLLVIIFMNNPAIADRYEIFIDIPSVLKIYIALVPLCAMFAAIQVSVALFAKSYKEGIYYLSLSGIGPMTAAFMDPEMASNINFLPLFWEAGIIRNNAMTTGSGSIMPNLAVLISITIFAFCVYYAQRRLKQEKMLK